MFDGVARKVLRSRFSWVFSLWHVIFWAAVLKKKVKDCFWIYLTYRGVEMSVAVLTKITC